MNRNWYWIELIGFDRELPDKGVGEFLRRTENRVTGVSLLLYDNDFVCAFDGYAPEKRLPPSTCSYAGHLYNEERRRQDWTYADLRALVDEFHRHDIPVIFAVFDLLSYRDPETGIVSIGPFSAAHPEIRAYSSVAGRSCGYNNMLKTLSDGRLFEDHFIPQTLAVTQAFGFDGFHAADGISSYRTPLQEGDYSDDIVNQFVAATGITLPRSIADACDHDPALHQRRYRYIFEKLRYPFTCFMAERYARFFNKLAGAFHAAGKFILFNNAWTRNPAESFLRYGIDYTLFDDKGVYGMMFEDVSTTMVLMGELHRGGFGADEATRRQYPYEFMLAAMELRLACPDRCFFNLSPVKDTMEQWDLIGNCPNELAAGLTRRTNAFIYRDGAFSRVSDGGVYCLSDGIDKHHWDFLLNTQEKVSCDAITGHFGFTAVYNPDFRGEIRRFIDDRYPTSDAYYAKLLAHKFPICAMCRPEDAVSCPTPLLLANPAGFAPDALSEILAIRDRVLVIIGCDDTQPDPCAAVRSDGTVIREGGFFCRIYNAPDRENVTLRSSYGKRRRIYDEHNALWTQELFRILPSDGFWHAAAAAANDCLGLRTDCPRDCTLFLLKTGENRARVLLFNNEACFGRAFLTLPFRVTAARYLTRPEWFRTYFDDHTQVVDMQNRSCEILELTFEM